MRGSSAYSSKNVISLVAVFGLFFWLLYSIASFLHESQKIDSEIESIRQTNEKLQVEIETKRLELAYLQTPQRIEKEAKMQMGKKRPGEQVIVFVEEKLDIVPPTITRRSPELPPELPVWQKWQWIFLGKKV